MSAAKSMQETIPDVESWGWRVVKDVRKEESFKVSDLEAISCLKGEEDFIRGEALCWRAEEFGANFGQGHANHLLLHQEEIPASFRRFNLMFPGTTWEDRDGELNIPALLLFGLRDRWAMRYYRLLDGVLWFPFDGLVRLRSKS